MNRTRRFPDSLRWFISSVTTSALFTGSVQQAGALDPGRPLTITDAIETARIMTTAPYFVDLPNGSLVKVKDSQAVILSPDRRRFAVMLITGDVARNGVWAEIVTGHQDSLNTVGAKTVARLFTTGLGSTSENEDLTSLTMPAENPPTWIDNRHIAIMWEDHSHTKQVISIDADTGQTSYLTNQSTAIKDFAVSPSGMLLYSAAHMSKEASLEDFRQRGFAVTALDARSLVLGNNTGGENSDYDFDRFISTPGRASARKVTMEKGGVNRFSSPQIHPKFSADGRFAIIDGTPDTIPGQWRDYKGAHFRAMLKEHSFNPDGFYARQFLKLFVLDLRSAIARPLWDAPLNIVDVPRALAWSPDAKFLIVGPTYLPAPHNDAGLSGSAIAIVNVNTGAFAAIPLSSGQAARMIDANWLSSTEIELRELNAPPIHFRQDKGIWKSVRGPDAHGEALPRTQRISVQVQQSIDTPPALYATDTKTGATRMLLDLEPRLRTDILLGKQEIVHFRDDAGRSWPGRLYYPAHFTPNERYPLVIQYHQPAPEDEFSLYGLGAAVGTGLGPGIGVYIAEPLAGRDIFTLQLGAPDIWKPSGAGSVTELETGEIVAHGFEAAVANLSSRGLVNPDKVGIMGHSASGWTIEYILSHSSFDYAAAIASDNKDGGYLQTALGGWTVGDGEMLNGASPFGTGLQEWLKNSPPFNADQVHTPLMLMTTAPIGGQLGPLMHWEMFSRLRYLGKPVELYVVPDLLHASHTLQNPAQILAVQQRALDWWCFWLKDERNSNPNWTTQYPTWLNLRALQRKERNSDPPSGLAQRDTLENP